MAVNSVSLTPPTGASTLKSPLEAVSGPSFSDVLANTVNNAMESQQTAATLTRMAAEGQDVPVSTIVQAISQAELTLQTLITVRDRAVEAYQQIQQMPI
ncbi:MAG: flagellar hook-basal body complex protein FliE [Alphaproteobacteria bacterium CG_4_10_14_0_8_um_filter_53_9]|nr:MAG: flagellar hook-basal body complex protein FliE [Alphaproteobacteria bacterium CG_4_10_14_0_8_um_filter_53_9]